MLSRTPGKILPATAAAAGLSSGTAAGLIAAAATARTTDSVHGLPQALVLALLLSACFSLAFLAVAVAVQLCAGLVSRQTEAREATTWPVLAVCILFCWGSLVGGLILHDLVLETPLPAWLFRPALVALVAVVTLSLYRGLRGHRTGTSVATVLLAGITVVAATWMSLQLSRGASPEPAQLPSPSLERQVFVFGVDGAEWSRIDKLIGEGRLPHFAALQARGYRASLATTRPTHSPIIWTSIMSGVGEDQHGIHGFTSATMPGLPCGLQGVDQAVRLPPKLGLGKLARLGYSIGLIEDRPISTCHRKVKNLWNVLSDVDLRVGIVNWFVSWPSDSVNGFLISDNNPVRARFNMADHGSVYQQSAGLTHPPELMAELADIDLPTIGSRPSEVLSLPFFQDLDDATLRELRAKQGKLDIFRTIYLADLFSAEATFRLEEREHLDFLAFYMSGVDNISHRFGRDYPDVVDRYYDYIDEVLGRLIDRMGDNTTIIVVSDHGWEYDIDGRFGHGYSPDGILLAAGSGVAEGARSQTSAGPDQPSIFDIAPTILRLYGLPTASYMQGNALTLGHGPSEDPVPQIASYGEYRPPPIPRPTVAEEAQMDETMDKLRALGYIQ